MADRYRLCANSAVAADRATVRVRSFRRWSLSHQPATKSMSDTDPRLQPAQFQPMLPRPLMPLPAHVHQTWTLNGPMLSGQDIDADDSPMPAPKQPLGGVEGSKGAA